MYVNIVDNKDNKTIFNNILIIIDNCVWYLVFNIQHKSMHNCHTY